MPPMKPDSTTETDRHYSVIRYYPHFSHGIIKEVLAEKLTLEEAEAFAERNAPQVAQEEVVVHDDLLTGLEAEVDRFTDLPGGRLPESF